MFNQQVIGFNAAEKQLNGIIHAGHASVKTGVLVVVGGPQYRVGSHRQFVHLARALAAEGIPVMRFDVTGMGDSEGDKKAFDQLDGDISAAIDAFLMQTPALENVVLWGLCDGASAALIYAPQDDRVSGLLLVNPWLENTQAQAQTQLWDYYLKRLLNVGFWKKLLSGRVDISRSAGELGATVGSVAQQQVTQVTEDGYQQRMLQAFQRLSVPCCWILSGNDLTAREFERQYRGDLRWQRASSNKRVSVEQHEAADHTFSTTAWKQWLNTVSLEFLTTLSK
tara:strand:- start:33223 stop:34065 length:843 start_codon:yes stop_codon:yes gene_type:complete